jgi:hypothetical protein
MSRENGLSEMKVVFAIASRVRDQRTVTQGSLFEGMRLFAEESVLVRAVNGLVTEGVIDRHPSGVLRWVGPAKGTLCITH